MKRLSQILKLKRIYFRLRLFWLFFLRSLLRARLLPNGALLHLGCEKKILKGWFNSDIVPFGGRHVIPIPGGLWAFRSRSARCIYLSHVIEHIDYPTQVDAALRHFFRILEPGGYIRIVVPGIEKIIRAYVADDQEFFRDQAARHPPGCTTKMEHLLYALQQNGEHKYGYDMETMAKVLAAHGFVEIQESRFGESRAEAMRNIDYHGKNLSLFVEARKPTGIPLANVA